jgi:hypothetical protein
VDGAEFDEYYRATAHRLVQYADGTNYALPGDLALDVKCGGINVSPWRVVR